MKPLSHDVDAVMIDLDGVVYEGDALLEGAEAAVRALRAQGLKLLFLTNNSARNAREIAEKLGRLGLAASPAEVLSTCDFAPVALRDAGLGLREGVFVVGSPSLRAGLDAAGLRRCEGPEAELVLVAMDTTFCYQTLDAALQPLRRGAHLWACNLDGAFPAGPGRWAPGCGALVGALTAASGRAVDRVLGKPSPAYGEAALARLAVPPHRAVMLGDTWAADIVMAQSLGITPVLIAPRSAHPEVASSPSLAHWVSSQLR